MGLPADPKLRAKMIGGRNRYNAQRKRLAQKRRLQLLDLLGGKEIQHGDINRLAQRFGVSRTTIWRDMQKLNAPRYCSICGQLIVEGPLMGKVLK